MRSTFITILAFLLISNAYADTEPNNIWQNATSLPQDSSVTGTQSDDDWYVINVVAGKRILIDLTFTHAEGDINMLFYDDGTSDPNGLEPGTFRDISAGTSSDDEFIDHDISSWGPGALYIRVYGDNNGNSYTLTWTELTGTDDGFEENDISADAKAITEDVVAFGSQSDDDWYSIDVTPGNRRVLASLRFYNTELATAIDLNMELLDSSGTSIALSANASGINESINAVVPAAGTYHVHVYGDNNADGYAIDWAGVNEAPQAIANTVSTTENIPYSFMASDFTFSDSEDDSLVSATLSSLSLGSGTLTHSSGTPVSNADTLTAAQLDTLVYTPPADTTGSPLASFTFTVNDADLGTVSAQLGINVTAVTTPAEGGGSSGALAPASLLVLLLTGLLRRKRC